MKTSPIVSRMRETKKVKKITVSSLIFLLLAGHCFFAQDRAELEAERKASLKQKGEHPISALMKSASSSLKKELEGVHPRVFLTQAEIDVLKTKAKTQKDLWRIALDSVHSLSVEPPPPPAETRRAQNDVGLGIAEAAFFTR